MANATRHRSRSEPAAPVLTREHDCFVGRFTAMASPCEVLVDSGAWSVIRRRQTVDDQLALES